jgi:hypothetical protein
MTICLQGSLKSQIRVSKPARSAPHPLHLQVEPDVLSFFYSSHLTIHHPPLDCAALQIRPYGTLASAQGLTFSTRCCSGTCRLITNARLLAAGRLQIVDMASDCLCTGRAVPAQSHNREAGCGCQRLLAHPCSGMISSAGSRCTLPTNRHPTRVCQPGFEAITRTLQAHFHLLWEAAGMLWTRPEYRPDHRAGVGPRKNCDAQLSSALYPCSGCGDACIVKPTSLDE